ncbi:leucyl aminopeptidase [Pseudactinotalea suaedae]|uniref:leucyl aminopeptidase n=1 Tax=Pseudactinotalea suaedae TaxID=1524924 RepID=UPI001F4F3CED|nr:leucyl aminopeptidase [Pseudactinotalea suaedae]
MTTVELNSTPLAKIRSDALVLATSAGDQPGVLAVAGLPKQLRAAVESAAKVVGVTGALDEVLKVPAPAGFAAPLLVLSGTGMASDAPLTAEALRRAAGSAGRQLAGTGTATFAFPVQTSGDAAAVAEGALLGAYSFTGYSGSPTPLTAVEVVVPDAKDKVTRTAVERAAVLAEAVHGVRDLVNTAPNDLYPASFADRAKDLAKGSKVSVTVLDEAALRAGGYGGLVGVGQGSTRGPRLVKLEWKPRKAAAHYALVGKGITFDSGGLSLKPAKSMETMKCDMAGAAAVLHTVLAAARLGVGVRVTGWLALAENMPSATAQRPSDVITIRGGRTVEVLNTDAEGRLVLADALVAAGEESPDALIDIATLTGAQMVALGNQVSAVMGTEDTRAEVLAAAEAAGEQFWPMPLPEELRASMKSPVADIANIGDRFGGMLVAGLFLREFTDGKPWAHLDIAGPAFNEGSARHYVPKGGTGVGVRTLLQLVEAAAGGGR